MHTCKKWYYSKTVWFNMLNGAIVFTDGLANLLTGLVDIIPADAYPWYVFVVAMINLFLRSITTSGIEK